MLQRVRCRQVRCALLLYILQHNCAQWKVAKIQNVFLTPKACSNYVPPTAIKKVGNKEQFDFCYAECEEVRHNVRLYYNFSVPTSQRTLSSSVIKKSVTCVQEYTHKRT
jgi:hypothetical protein